MNNTEWQKVVEIEIKDKKTRSTKNNSKSKDEHKQHANIGWFNHHTNICYIYLQSKHWYEQKTATLLFDRFII